MYNTGTLCHQVTDFEIDGLIPCKFSRVYRSSHLHPGPLGYGWYWPWDISITLSGCELVHRTAGGLIENHFKLDDAANGLIRSGSGAVLFLGGAYISVNSGTPWIYRFPVPSPACPTVGISAIHDLRGNMCRITDSEWDGTLKGLEDANGRQYRIVRDLTQRIVAIELKGGVSGLPSRLVTYNYDSSGDLVRVDDRCGANSAYEYRDHLMVAYRNRVGGWYYAHYDQSRRCVSISRSDGYASKTYRYDSANRQALIGDALGNRTLARFGGKNEIIGVIEPDARETEMVYDSASRLTATIDGSGPSSTVSVENSDHTSATHVRSTEGCEYGVVTDLVGRKETTTDCAGATWTRTFDELGNLTAITTPLQASYHFSHDPRGNVVQATLPTGNVVRYNYSRDHRELAIVDAVGPVAFLAWDDENRLTSRKLPETNPEQYRYDALGRLIEIVRPNGASLKFVLDAEGHCTSVINEIGDTKELAWSAFGDLIGGVDALGCKFRKRYDSVLRLTAIENAASEVTELDYDSGGRLTSQRRFDGEQERFQYDPKGSLRRIVYSDGSEVHVRMDGGGRLQEITGGGHSVRFEYDPRGYPVKAERDGVVVGYEYDLEGRPIMETQDGVALHRKYDIAGNCTSLTVPGLGVRQSEYDVRQRLVRLVDFNSEQLCLTYDLNDRCVSVTATGTGETLEYEYLPENRVVQVRLRSAAATAEVRYDYDRAGRVIRRLGPDGEREEYAYRADGCLARIMSDTRSTDLSYTSTLDHLRDAGGHGITYFHGGRIRTAGERTFAFDARGRTISVSDPSHRVNFVYDHLN